MCSCRNDSGCARGCENVPRLETKFPFPFSNTPLEWTHDESSQLHSNEKTDEGVTGLVQKDNEQAYQRELQRSSEEIWGWEIVVSQPFHPPVIGAPTHEYHHELHGVIEQSARAVTRKLPGLLRLLNSVRRLPRPREHDQANRSDTQKHQVTRPEKMWLNRKRQKNPQDEHHAGSDPPSAGRSLFPENSPPGEAKYRRLKRHDPRKHKKKKPPGYR